MGRVLVPWAPPSVFQARLWAKKFRNISFTAPLPMLSAIWLCSLLRFSSLLYFLFSLTCRLFLWLPFTHNFLTGPSFLPHAAHPCRLVSWAFFYIQIFSWTTFHPLQLFLFTAFAGDSALFPCVGSVNVFVLGRHWFPSSWCLGHICSQIHM